MKARVTVFIMGDEMLRPGDEVEGDVAADLVKAGFATLIPEAEREAVASPKGAVTRKVK